MIHKLIPTPNLYELYEYSEFVYIQTHEKNNILSCVVGPEQTLKTPITHFRSDRYDPDAKLFTERKGTSEKKYLIFPSGLSAIKGGIRCRMSLAL